MSAGAPLPPQVQRALAEGKLIDAIRLLRGSRGLDLKAAKELIDAAQRSASGTARAAATTHFPSVADADVDVAHRGKPHDLLAEETRRLQQGLGPGEVSGRSSSLGSGLLTAVGALLVAWLGWRWWTGG